MSPSIRPAPLAVITGVSAATVGVLMTLGGVALLVAILTTEQPTLQLVTACVLLVAGAADLRSSFGIRRHQSHFICLSASATVILLAYLGGVLRDFGDVFWLNAALLILILILGHRTSRRPTLV
jgi:uncharacterized membrane protein HdeD (DUF308 family)